MITRIHSATVVVSNQDAALAFYVGKLGWEKRADEPMGESYRWLTVAPAGGDAELALNPPHVSSRPPGGDSGISLDVADIDETFRTLAGRGVVFIDEKGAPIDVPLEMPWGAKAAWIKDPDGNTFFFIQELTAR